MTIAKFRLESGEAALVESLAVDLCTETVADEEFSLDQVRERANAIPQDVTSLMGRMRSRNERLSAVLLSGVDLTSLDAVATPTSFGRYGAAPSLRALDALLLLFGVALGTPYCFATQQRGTLVLDVFPLRGREDDQLGCSSTTLLEWHNEDAFHSMRADFSMLMCIRNDQGAATRYAAAAELHLAAKVEQELRKPQFVILPDESHSYAYNLATSGVSEAEQVFNDIERMTTTFSPAPVLAGAPDDPLICVDFAYMPPNLHTSSANQALASLRRSIDRVGRSVVLKKGDIFIFDNRRGVHGRDAFTANYDGNDRWLKRLNVLTDTTAPSADGTGFRTLGIG